MNIEKLRYALEIERCGTINKAAHNLFVSQPHLSKSLKMLEDSLGVTIFQRTKQGVMVTNEGKEFLQYAKAIVNQMDLMTEKYNSRKTEGLNLKISSVRSSGFMEGFVHFMDLYKKSESMRITFKETGPFEVLNDVKNEDSGIGFIFSSFKERAFFQNIVKSNQLEYYKVATFKGYVTMSNQNKLAGEPVIDIGKIKNFTYVAYGEYENTLLNVDNEHKLVNLEIPDKVVTLYDRCTLLEILSRKDFYTISHKLSPSLASRYGLVCIPPREALYDVEVGYVKLPLKILTSEEERLIDAVKSRYDNGQ